MAVRLGDRGDQVERLQLALQRFGFDVGNDGIFGRRTEAAIREFQASRSLTADGIAGDKTLRALRLDPQTLEQEDADHQGGFNEEVVTFEPHEVDVPRHVQDTIVAMVASIDEQRRTLLTSLLHALDQFETTVSFASGHEADADVLGSLASTAFSLAAGEVESRVPGMKYARALFDSTAEELQRADSASQSFQIGNWIKDQRAAVADSLRQGFPKNARESLRADLESDFLDLDSNGRQVFLGELQTAVELLSNETNRSLDEMEAHFYEAWINCHFEEIGEDTMGCIEYRLEFAENTFDFVSCHVSAPFGANIDSALNRLLTRGNLKSIRRPADFRVFKRICLRVDNFVGGKSWSCGWMDENNQIIHEPVHPSAQQGLREDVWRVTTKRFSS